MVLFYKELKPKEDKTQAMSRFESGVILQGTQTGLPSPITSVPFESGVILQGTQTLQDFTKWLFGFESGVILQGTQTDVLSVPLLF